MKYEQKKFEQRRAHIHQAWDEHYSDLVLGEISMAEILGYDDERLMALADRGLRFYKVAKYDAALKVFHGLVVLDPWIPYFHYLLGTAHEKLGNLDAANLEYEKTLEMTEELEPTPDLTSFAALAKGRVLARQGAVAEALAILTPVATGKIQNADSTVVHTAGLIVEHLRRGEES